MNFYNKMRVKCKNKKEEQSQMHSMAYNWQRKYFL